MQISLIVAEGTWARTRPSLHLHCSHRFATTRLTVAEKAETVVSYSRQMATSA